MTSLWALTHIEHPGLAGMEPDCRDCLVLAEDAITHARLTGSVGWVLAVEAYGTRHSATVARVIRTFER